MDRKLLDILACPNCKGKLIYEYDSQELICRFDKLAFPIRNDIPVMLIDQARRINTNTDTYTDKNKNKNKEV